MRVKFKRYDGNFLKDSGILRNLEIKQIKKQIEILTTFLPDILIKIPQNELLSLHRFVGVILFADVSGFTSLCEKYNKIGKGGVYRLTATLNAYIGAIIEAIYFYGGDVLKFSGDAFLALWKAKPDQCLYQVIHQVIVCGLFIQKTLGHFQTDVNVLLKVKIAISCGNITFSVVGDDSNQQYVVIGDAINEVKAAERASVSGDVIVGPAAWGHLVEENYDVTYDSQGFVKVWRSLYKPNETQKKNEYEKKDEMAQILCKKHVNHRLSLQEQKKCDDVLTDTKITETFVRSLPPREVLKIAKQTWTASDMKRFVIKPLQEQIEENQPLEYLTEMREVTIQFINIVPQNHRDMKLVGIINTSYQIVCKIVNDVLGVVNKVSLFDKDVMILVIFGLRGIKHELESQNALISGFQITESLSKLDGVKTVSVGITNGLVYCGVVGHPLRKEFTVIGGAVNKAARIMCGYEQKITCDHKTFKHSKLSSYYFQIQSDITLKGIEDVGHIYEYNEKFDEPLPYESNSVPIIGRKSELQLVNRIMEGSIEDYLGVCFYGLQKTGKTKLLKSVASGCKHSGFTVASVTLTSFCLRSYFCISLLYKQLYNDKGNVKSGDKDVITNLPAEIWDLNGILQKSLGERYHVTDKIETWFKKICVKTILCIDNIQFIDLKSLEILLRSLGESTKLFCTGFFEEDTWEIQWKLSRSNLVKTINLSPMEIEDVSALCCQFLKTKGVSKKLVSLLDRTCEGRPGWIQSCLLRLVNNGSVEIKLVSCDTDAYAYPEKSNKGLSLIPVAHLDNNFNEYSEELSLAAISMDLFDSFPPYQQLVIKTGAVLGEFFSRTLLFVILKYPNDQIFTNAIMNLFEEDVFDCGSRYVTSGTLLTKRLACYCYWNESEFAKKHEQLPKYAFCKLLHFKNRNLRTVAYELLPANQRKELHSHVTDVLENQNNLCPNCLRDDSASIIYLNTFKRTTQNRRETYNRIPLFDELRDIIREDLQKNVSAFNVKLHKLSRKIWDPTNCFCLEILTRVCADLIYHSDQAGHLGKKIFYLMQYGIVLLTLGEFKECIPVLTEASELCMTDAENKDSVIHKRFRKTNFGKIHTLLAEAHFRLGNVDVAKVHVSISLRQYDVPMTSLYYKIPHLLYLNRPKAFNEMHYPLFKEKTSSSIDFGICMNTLSNIYAYEGNWKFAKRTALRSLYLLTNANPNIFLLCDVYANAIELYNGNSHACESIERCIGRDLLRVYTVQNVLVELYAVCKLISILLKIRMFHGYILSAIKLGCRAIDINHKINAYFVQAEIIPIVATALLLAKKIDKAVSVINLIYNIGVTSESSALIDYYAFCVELNLETGFYLEPIEKCIQYIEQNLPNKLTHTDSENKIIVYLYLYYLRYNKWLDALKWKNLIKTEPLLENSTFIAVSSFFKYTECLLISLVSNLSLKKIVVDIDEQRIESMLKNCKKISKKWKVFRPRCFHYMAYYKKIVNEKRETKRYLKKAIALSKKQNNILEACWIRQNQHAWKNGVTLSHAVKPVHWRLSNTYDESEWSAILYVLPYQVND